MSTELNSRPPVSWRAIVLNDFGLKFWGISVFMTLFFWAYLYLLKNPAFPVYVMPLTLVDRWIDFSPLALIPYLSLWLYCTLPVYLVPTRRRLVNYGVWVALMCLLALAVFYGLPNAVPPANIDWAQYPGVAFLKGVDASGNACPSLHVAAAVYAGFWLYWLLAELRADWRWQVAQVSWCLAIAYSTVATRQHVALDVLAGGVLAVLFSLGSRWADRRISARGT